MRSLEKARETDRRDMKDGKNVRRFFKREDTHKK